VVVVGIVAVDHPVVMPGAVAALPVWDRDPAALPAVAHRLQFPGPMVEVGARDGLLCMLCRLADPEQPVHVLPADGVDEGMTEAAALNGLDLLIGPPTLLVARHDIGPEPVMELIASARPALLLRPGQDPPLGYASVHIATEQVALYVPDADLPAAQAAVHAAQAERARAHPPWLNTGTAAALRLLDLQREDSRRREVGLQQESRRAYDQMEQARTQMQALRLRRGRR
jgi:hypothetical protein